MQTAEEDGLLKILVLLRKARGSDFGAYKKKTLQRRIARRMAVNRIETLEDYARRLEGDASEIEALYRDIRPYVSLCRFPDCTHTHESHGAVKDAVADNRLDARRYESYCHLRSGDDA